MLDKYCPKCETVKAPDQFYKKGRGLSGWCKDCVRAHSHAQAESGYFKQRRTVIRGSSPVSRKHSDADKCAARLYDNARKRSLHNGYPFDLTPEWVRDSVAEFCGSNYYSFAARDPFRPSLDRIDGSRKGYTQDNVRVTWLIENYARNTFTDEQLIEFCKRKLGLL